MSSKIDVAKIQSPIENTVMLMAASAAGGVCIGTLVFVVGSVGSTLLTANFILLPIALATAFAAATSSLTIGLICIPIWTIIGGWLFAYVASADGSTTRQLGVTFFANDHPIFKKVNELAAELSLPPIKWVGWFEDEAINAYAVGTHQNNALIGLSKGAIEKLTKEQLDAIIGHELGHVASNDMIRMTFARGAQEALSWFLIWRGLKNVARWFFTPLSELQILHHSRQREFTADAVGATLTSKGAMIGALRAIQTDSATPSEKTQGISTLMFWGNFDGFFATHPPIEERIAALDEGRVILTSSD